ncbi:hypothetical protein VTO73DRAFT_7380 [Trametes versicolor]
MTTPGGSPTTQPPSLPDSTPLPPPATTPERTAELAARAATTNSMSTKGWELPSGVNSLVPTRPLENEDGYRAWSMQMQGALEYATLWTVVSGEELAPSSSDTTALSLWKRKDGAARTLIMRNLAADLQSTVNTLDTAMQFWTTLKTQFSRTSLTSAVTWFRSLVTPLSSVHNLEPHIQAYLEAIAHLKSSGFSVPDQMAAGIFLSTLVDIDGEPTQWLAFTAKFSLTDSTTLNSTLADVRNERRRVVGMKPPGSSTDTAMALDGAASAGAKGADRLYHLDTPSESAFHVSTNPYGRLQDLHGRLGHLNYQSIRKLVRKGLVRGVKLSKAELNAEPPPCSSCMQGKMTRASFPRSQSGRPERELFLASTDLWGEAQVQTPDGKRYVMTITDHYHRWLWVAFLRHKSDAFGAFKEWLARVERETGLKLAKLRADNGGEYVGNAFKDFCKERGIQLQTTSPRTPEQNGAAESQNRSIFDRVRTILIDSGLPLNLWGEAVNYIVYTKNRNPTAALDGSTPFQTRYGHAPDISFLHRFGCRAYVYNDHPSRRKLDPRAREGIFVGYADNQKAYRVYFPDTQKLVTSIHVRFHDNANGFSGTLPEGEKDYDSLIESFDPQADLDDSRPSHGQTSETSALDAALNEAATVPDAAPDEQQAPIVAPPAPDAPPAPRPRGRPKGSKNKKGGVAVRHSSRVRAKAGVEAAPNAPAEEPHPPQAVAAPEPPLVEHPVPGGDVPEADMSESDLTELSESERSNDEDESANLIGALLEHSFAISGDEPQTYKEAMASPEANEWEAAMVQELESIASLGSFELTSLPPGRKPIGTRWVFLVKRDTNGNVLRYKARLVAQGFTQQPGVDFQETFALVAKAESIRAICAIAAQRDGIIHVVNVDSAFLNSEMPDDQEAYVKQPPGFTLHGQETKVWRLRKALYGLRQSGYLWYRKLKSIMTSIGFTTCQSDPCVFFRYDHDRNLAIVTSHVDDLAIFGLGLSLAAVNKIKDEIRREVPIKDGQDISLLLGVKITRDLKARTISFSHTHKIDKALEEFGFKDAHPVWSPMLHSQRLSASQAPQTPKDIAFMRNVKYMSAVGTLMHIAVHTRPDISKAVQSVARFMANPGKPHWQAVKRIFQYLKGTRDYVLTVGGNGTTQPLAYCDTDWGNDPDTAKSTSGYAIFIGQGCISWSAKKQTVVALSTGEAEYYASTHCGREIIWLRQLLSELGLLPSPRPPPTPLRIDSTTAIKMINNPDEVSNRTKHINISYHWIRDAAQSQLISTKHISGEENVADIFTKPLGPQRHKQLALRLGLRPSSDRVR